MSPSNQAAPVERPYRWREWEFWVLALAAVLLYSVRFTDAPIRGEEPRRAQVAREIIRTGDWIVPRQQGVPFLSRPPLGSYPIAVLAMLIGDCTPLAVRLPSVLATILATLLVYSYARTFLSRLGALAAGLAFATMGQVLQLGRLAETEAIFTLLLSGSLLVWHWGYSQNWRRPWMWMAGYGLAALATLAKGPQAPVYFAAAVGLFLIWRRDWRTLFGWPHLAGIAAFALIVGAWQVPFTLRMGWQATRQLWTGDVALRFVDQHTPQFFTHLVTFPIEVLICTLPWSALLLAFLFRDFRRSLGVGRDSIIFAAIALVVAFPSCWFVPGARGRYFMPLYPCMAVLIGYVVERMWEPAASRFMRLGRSLSTAAMAVTFAAFGLAVVVVSCIPRFQASSLAQPIWLAAVFAAITVGASIVLWANRGAVRPGRPRVVLLVIVAFIGVSFQVVIVDFMSRASEQTADAVASIKANLPPNARLFSFGLLDPEFTYYYGQPVEPRGWPQSARELPEGREYFCFSGDTARLPAFPFGWRSIAIVSCDRWHSDRPQRTVIVGQRIDSLAARPRTSR